jgi:hypothetical protein
VDRGRKGELEINPHDQRGEAARVERDWMAALLGAPFARGSRPAGVGVGAT